MDCSLVSEFQNNCPINICTQLVLFTNTLWRLANTKKQKKINVSWKQPKREDKIGISTLC